MRFSVRTHGIRTIKDAMSREAVAELEQAGIAIATARLDIVGTPAAADARPALRGERRQLAGPTGCG